jgi:hypothetical protein
MVSSWSFLKHCSYQTAAIMMRRNVTAANFVGADPPGYFARIFASVNFTKPSGGLASVVEPQSDSKDLTQYVNPFIGTGGHGHTFPERACRLEWCSSVPILV